MNRSISTLLALLLALLSSCATELVCPAGETDCGGHCVALLTDPRNCGTCGRTVTGLQVCSAGLAACAPDVTSCGGTCTDLARDPLHCGACDAVACDPAPFCTTASGLTSCTASCPAGFSECGRSCVDLLADRFHCGACGSACPAGQACREGSCRAPIQVACYATNEVLPVTRDLAPAGAPRATPSGPTSIVVHESAVYSANGYPQASVSILPLDPARTTYDVAVAGNDLQHIGVQGNVVMVTNASTGSLLFLSPSGVVLDELPMPNQQNFPNPRGFAVVGSAGYVALSGSGYGNGQSIARVDLSGLALCAASPLDYACGAVVGEIDLTASPGASDSPGLPFPSEVVAVGGRIYVALANLQEDTLSCGTGCSYTAWVKPAGNGRLAVVDPAAADAVSIVDLGASCRNPGALAYDGFRLWVSCGSWSYSGIAPSIVLPVDVASATPAVGTPIDLTGIVPGKLAFCDGLGYVTDQSSGQVVRFDPATRTVEAPVEVCPMTPGPYGWSWASDVACAP